MTSTFGQNGFEGHDLGGVTGAVGRLGRILGWAVFSLMLILAVTVALLTTVVIGAVLALAAVLLAFGRGKPQQAPRGDGMTLEARPTPDGWVIEPSSSAR
jgi:hypothetical protein